MTQYLPDYFLLLGLLHITIYQITCKIMQTVSVGSHCSGLPRYRMSLVHISGDDALIKKYSL